MPVLEQRGDYWISTDTALLDFFVIHRFIAEESYWGKGRTAEIMQRAIDHSALCFGLYLRTTTGCNQIGFARVISDLTTFAYLSDVFVLSEHRGKGLGKWLITTIRLISRFTGYQANCFNYKNSRILRSFIFCYQ